MPWGTSRSAPRRRTTPRRSAPSTTRASRIASPRSRPSCARPRSGGSGWRARGPRHPAVVAVTGGRWSAGAASTRSTPGPPTTTWPTSRSTSSEPGAVAGWGAPSCSTCFALARSSATTRWCSPRSPTTRPAWPSTGRWASRRSGCTTSRAARRPMGRRADHGAPALSYGWIVVARPLRHRDRHVGHHVLRLPRLPAPDGGGPRRLAGRDHRRLHRRPGVAALAALPVGRWLDRHGGRGLMTIGSCLGTALTLAWSPRGERGGALRGVVADGPRAGRHALRARLRGGRPWFPTDNRDRALPTVTLAGPLASTIFMPIEARAPQHWGWRPALHGLAASSRS